MLSLMLITSKDAQLRQRGPTSALKGEAEEKGAKGLSMEGLAAGARMSSANEGTQNFPGFVELEKQNLEMKDLFLYRVKTGVHN